MKNKVLLINPPFNITKDNYDSSISVGLLSMATWLNHRGVPVEIIDGVRQSDYLDLIKAKAGEAEYAAISVMTMQIFYALKISELLKSIKPTIKIIWGGTHPTFFIEQTIKHPLIDAICYGEGEETIYEIASGKDWSQINGLAYRQGEQIVINPPRALHDPAQMPLFDWDLVSREILRNLYLIPSLTSRGCPHRCTFCINAILKNHWRPRTVEQILRDLEIIKQKEYFRDKKLRFWDENFFVDINRAKQVIDGMIERNLTMPWETTVRADYINEGKIDDEFLAKLKQSGCYLLSFGAESGSPRMLTKIKKDITPEDIIRSARMCLKHDIIPQYSFMIGLPGETKADMMLTLKLIDRLIKLSDQIQILGPQAFRPYPGSELYNECVAAGWQAPQSLAEWSQVSSHELNYLAVKNFPWVEDKDFVESMEAYVRFGAQSIKSAMGSTIKAQTFLKLGFVLLCQLRWKLKFFKWPVEFKLAKKFVTK
ncbi:MAG: radical SAM protein [Patescibacteria group bacterium]